MVGVRGKPASLLPCVVIRHTPRVTPSRNYIWAFLAVLSRSFTFKASSEGVAGSRPPEPGLAPFVDMVNHHENPHVIVQVTRDAFRVPFRAAALALAALFVS